MTYRENYTIHLGAYNVHGDAYKDINGPNQGPYSMTYMSFPRFTTQRDIIHFRFGAYSILGTGPMDVKFYIMESGVNDTHVSKAVQIITASIHYATSYKSYPNVELSTPVSASLSSSIGGRHGHLLYAQVAADPDPGGSDEIYIRGFQAWLEKRP